MSATCCIVFASSTLHGKFNGTRCCSSSSKQNKKETPQLLKIAVSGVTELLRFFSFDSKRLDASSYKRRDDVLLSSVDDILQILKSDYENAYFVTGKDLYSRNLKLLVPFFEYPSIELEKIEKGTNSETTSVLATWKLRTFLRLPWRPLISIDGSTVYDLDNEFKIVRHAESWSVSALEAVGQIFTPSFGRRTD